MACIMESARIIYGKRTARAESIMSRTGHIYSMKKMIIYAILCLWSYSYFTGNNQSVFEHGLGIFVLSLITFILENPINPID